MCQRYLRTHHCLRSRIRTLARRLCRSRSATATGYRRSRPRQRRTQKLEVLSGSSTEVPGKERRTGREVTRDLPHDVTEAAMRAALEEDLPSVFAATVKRSSVTTVGGYTWYIDLVAVDPSSGPRVALYAEGHLLYARVGGGVSGNLEAASVMVDSWRSGELDTYCPPDVQSGRAGDAFVVEFTGPSELRGDTSYLGLGRYKVEYTTPRADGIYDMSVGVATRGWSLRRVLQQSMALRGLHIQTRRSRAGLFVGRKLHHTHWR